MPPRRTIYLEIPPGLKSYGGYELLKKYETVQLFKDYPTELMIMSKGSLLSLSGDKKLPLLGRNVHNVKYSLHRVLPSQLNQFIFNNYNRSSEFGNSALDRAQLESLSEVFEQKVSIPFRGPSKTQYFSLDLDPFINKDGGGKKGLFLIEVSEKEASVRDRRLVLLTDLGVIVKQANDKTHSVFVQNLRNGAPVANAEVDIMGANGLSVLTQKTGLDGRANFPDLTDFKNEKRPIAFVVKKDGDLSFLPFQMSERSLTYSQFDIGGVQDDADTDQLTSFLFSDRGIYRPGDSVNIGLMVRSHDWKTAFNHLPIYWTATDPKGTEVHREKLEVGSNELTSLSFNSQDDWITGTYNIQVFISKKDEPDSQIGSLAVRIEEFVPDRMRVSASLIGAKAQGWIKPEGVVGHVSLKNLFGTPAENRRIQAEMALAPMSPSFKPYKDYLFSTPKTDEKSFNENLTPSTTNEKGEADFQLDLSRFSSSMYWLHFNVEGFEAAGGRAVTASATTLVSALPYLIGIKTDGSLSYLSKDSDHQLHVIAIDSDLKKIAVGELQSVLVEKKYVSALMEQPDGTYKYQSLQKEVSQEAHPLSVNESGASLKVPTQKPGDFVLIIKNKAGTELNRVSFTVAGSANLSRSLDKNAELQVTLSRQDYKSGQEIEMQIKAP